MVRIREQHYPDRGTGWVLECPDCGWWRAPVWNHIDAIQAAGLHELAICPAFPSIFAQPEQEKK
jgi:hypothetical protein